MFFRIYNRYLCINFSRRKRGSTLMSTTIVPGETRYEVIPAWQVILHDNEPLWSSAYVVLSVQPRNSIERPNDAVSRFASARTTMAVARPCAIVRIRFTRPLQTACNVNAYPDCSANIARLGGLSLSKGVLIARPRSERLNSELGSSGTARGRRPTGSDLH